jgi:polysaccharide biosynthesis protein PslH
MTDEMMNGDPKRILYLATFDPTVSSTGTTTRGKLFLDFFTRHYEVHLVHLEERHQDGRDHDLIDRLKEVESIPFSKQDYFLYSRKLYKAAARQLEKKKFDLIIADFEKAGFYAYQLSRRFGVPYVYSSHNVEYQRYMHYAQRSLARLPFVPYMYVIERLASQNAMLTISISEQDAQAFRKWIPEDRLLVLPGAFDEKKFNPFYTPVDRNPPVILMVGNYSLPGNREGVYRLVRDIMPEVLAARPEVIFRCVGKSFPEDLHHPNLEVAGFVDDLTEEYRQATAVVVPITYGGGIKIKAVEGLASGKQVIMTPKGAEGIDTRGLKHVYVTEIDAFADCILQVLENPVLRTTENWEQFRLGYGVQAQLEQLNQVIGERLAA